MPVNGWVPGAPNGDRKMSETVRLIIALKALELLGQQHPDRDPDNPAHMVTLMAAFARSTVEKLTEA
mgnify:CR=1 FL=1